MIVTEREVTEFETEGEAKIWYKRISKLSDRRRVITSGCKANKIIPANKVSQKDLAIMKKRLAKMLDRADLNKDNAVSREAMKNAAMDEYGIYRTGTAIRTHKLFMLLYKECEQTKQPLDKKEPSSYY